MGTSSTLAIAAFEPLVGVGATQLHAEGGATSERTKSVQNASVSAAPR